MKLTLARHGETIENVNKIVQGQAHGTLTKNGHDQAKQLAEELKAEKFDAIFSSDLKRCTDTAEYILAYHRDTPFETTPALREYTFGIYDGRPSSEVDWGAMTGGDVYNRKPEGGESVLEGRERVLRFLAEIYNKYPDKNILFITHGGPMRVVRQYVLNRPMEELRTFEIGNCATLNYEINEPINLDTE